MRFRTDDATGLWPGNNVTLSGFRIGKVSEVSMASDGLVDVTLLILPRYRRLIGPASHASSAQEGLVGDTVVILTPDITPAGESAPVVDLRLPFQPASRPADLLKDLAETRLQLDTTLQAIASVVEEDLPDAVDQVDGTLTDVRRLARTAESETVRTASVTRETLRLYQQTGEQIGSASDEASTALQETSPALSETLREIKQLSANANRILQQLAGTFLFPPDEPQSVSPDEPPVLPVTEPLSDQESAPNKD
ncbi:MlaD family protein [Synechococcus sp. RSCCF101]|uniref:MlaD family protein n=1 Tax=Synechococcus sp. RSCCF101 TaxID=2511069 RepID=UPI001784EE69|nr:MlaD family protein [Synechococcus sp. RSCCF101]